MAPATIEGCTATSIQSKVGGAIEMKNSPARKLKQVSAGYLRVGVDPHKKRHAAVAMTEDLMVQSKFKFASSRGGFEEALERVRAEMAKTGCRGVIFAIETGGHYWRNFGLLPGGQGRAFPAGKPVHLEAEA